MVFLLKISSNYLFVAQNSLLIAEMDNCPCENVEVDK